MFSCKKLVRNRLTLKLPVVVHSQAQVARDGSLDCLSVPTEFVLFRQIGLSLDVPAHRMFAAALMSLSTNLFLLFSLSEGPHVVQHSLE